MTLRETLERVRSMAVPRNEEAAKFKIIMPILRDLGWDDMGAEVILEHSVGASGRRRKSGGGRVDIALAPDPRRPVALIEAKAPGQDLNDHVGQVLAYAFHEGVTICVLTNGPHWWLYLPREAGQPTDRRFAELDLRTDSLEEITDDLETFLSREALVSGSAEMRAHQVLKARRETDLLNEKLPELWQAILGRPSGTPHSELVELVSRHAYEQTGLRPEPEQIADVIQGRPISPMPSGKATPTTTRVRAATKRKKGKKKGQRSPKPTAFVLWGQRHEVRYYYEILVGVTEAIHGYGHDLGRIRELTSGIPLVSQDPAELRRGPPKPVGNTGWYVDTTWYGHVIVKRARQFLELFGYNPDDLEVFYEPSESPGSSTPPPLRPEGQGQGTEPSARPTGFELWGQRHLVHYYYEILVGVAEALCDRHPHDFHRIGNASERVVNQDPGELKRPKQVRASGWYVNADWIGRKHLHHARQFLEIFGYNPDDLEVLYD